MISVIIPLYNKEQIIERTIRSVLSQDYDDFEVVIVNDGSTDKSMEVLERALPGIKQELNVNTPVTIISQENGGPSKARNTGVKNAKGDWIVFLDADDELTEHSLKMMMEEVCMYLDADIIDFNNYNKVKETLEKKLTHSLNGKINNPFKKWFYHQIDPGCGHTIFRYSFIKEFPYNEKIRRYEDAEILFRTLKYAHVYSSSKYVEIHNLDFTSASSARNNIDEDFIGHLNIDVNDFWSRMCLFRLFIEERNYYPFECRRLYSSWFYRFDLLLLLKILSFLSKWK